MAHEHESDVERAPRKKRKIVRGFCVDCVKLGLPTKLVRGKRCPEHRDLNRRNQNRKASMRYRKKYGLPSTPKRVRALEAELRKLKREVKGA